MYGQLMHNTGRETLKKNRVARLFDPLPPMPEIDDRPKSAPEHVWKVGDKFKAKKWKGLVDDCQCNADMERRCGELQEVKYIGEKEVVSSDGWAWPKSKCTPARKVT